ncbi:MAG: LysR family transcriptional regulator [Methylococcales bacterium]|nr:LysR family transcriptional regulator [Methylococcales bacterium]
MNPNHLLTFSVAARLQSITQAADFLHLGQPAVSGQLKILQDFVGEPLYQRRGHKLELTPAGEGLLEYANRMDKNFKQAIEYVKSLKQVNVGRLRIVSTMTVASYYLPRVVVQLQTLYAGVQVFMETSNTAKIIEKMPDFDLGFIEGPVDEKDLPSNYEVIPWQDDEIVLVLPENHVLTKEYPDTVPLIVFTKHQVIWREAGSGARQALEKALLESGIIAPVNIEVTGVSGVKESVRAGLGIGFASSKALLNEKKGLVARRINFPKGLIWHLNIIAPKPIIQSRVARVFIDLCREKENR